MPQEEDCCEAPPDSCCDDGICCWSRTNTAPQGGKTAHIDGSLHFLSKFYKTPVGTETPLDPTSIVTPPDGTLVHTVEIWIDNFTDWLAAGSIFSPTGSMLTAPVGSSNCLFAINLSNFTFTGTYPSFTAHIAWPPGLRIKVDGGAEINSGNAATKAFPFAFLAVLAFNDAAAPAQWSFVYGVWENPGMAVTPPSVNWTAFPDNLTAPPGWFGAGTGYTDFVFNATNNLVVFFGPPVGGDPGNQWKSETVDTQDGDCIGMRSTSITSYGMQITHPIGVPNYFNVIQTTTDGAFVATSYCCRTGGTCTAMTTGRQPADGLCSDALGAGVGAPAPCPTCHTPLRDGNTCAKCGFSFGCSDVLEFNSINVGAGTHAHFVHEHLHELERGHFGEALSLHL